MLCLAVKRSASQISPPKLLNAETNQRWSISSKSGACLHSGASTASHVRNFASNMTPISIMGILHDLKLDFYDLANNKLNKERKRM